jgi:hypothetical protein
MLSKENTTPCFLLVFSFKSYSRQDRTVDPLKDISTATRVHSRKIFNCNKPAGGLTLTFAKNKKCLDSNR